MLAKFENGYFLEVIAEIDEEDTSESRYEYEIYDSCLEFADLGWTEYRSIDMYYPMNEIDYILKFCEPDYVKGEYKLLPFKTMEEYKEFLREYPNGEWVLERQGSYFDHITSYKTEEAARIVMLNEVEENVEYGRKPIIKDDYCEINGEGSFQCWRIYQKYTSETEKDNICYEIGREFDRVYSGIAQYAWELQDTWVITHHVDRLEELIERLKEII